jgi:sugar-specific transcriptional regulator TrmB
MPPIDPEVRGYLDRYREFLETRYKTLEREISESRRNPPGIQKAEFAAETASTAVVGVAELHELLDDFKREVSLKIQELGANLEKKIWLAMSKANARTRIWVASIAGVALVVVAVIGLVDHQSTANARELSREVCRETWDEKADVIAEHDRRLVTDAAMAAVQARDRQLDTIRGGR